MKLKKKSLEIVLKATKETKLNLADSRIRDRFMGKVNDETKVYYVERQEIFKKFCTKDEKDKPIVTDDKYIFDPEVVPQVNIELIELLDEEVDIAVENPEKVKEIIEGTEYKPEFGETELLDEVIKPL